MNDGHLQLKHPRPPGPWKSMMYDDHQSESLSASGPCSKHANEWGKGLIRSRVDSHRLCSKQVCIAGARGELRVVDLMFFEWKAERKGKKKKKRWRIGR